MLGHHWEPAIGVCIDTRWKGGSSGSSGTDRTHWLMEVRPTNGEAFRVELGYPGFHEDFKGPGIGQTCRMECDVKHQRARFDLSDPDLTWSAGREKKNAEFEAKLHADPADTPRPARTAGSYANASGLGLISPNASPAPTGPAPISVAPTGAAPTGGVPDAPPADPAERLTRLESLHQKGLLTDTEYQDRRSKIIESL